MNTKKETGQALPLGIAFLMSSLLLGIVLFNTAQTASEKSRLTNAADAAVYSGLVWQARALNFQAYTNRAMVANQVSIGQLVSLTTWTDYAYIVARRINAISNYFPIVDEFTQAAQEITERIDDVMVNVAEVFIPIIDSVNGVLSRTQQAIYVASFAATPGIVREVVEENDQRYSASTAYAVIGMGENASGWQNIIRQYDDSDGLLRKVDVVNRSKDEFTVLRNLSTEEIIPGEPNRLNLGFVRVWVTKEGRTNLVIESNSTTTDDVDFEWKGKDTLSLHIERWDFGDQEWDHEELPIAWGSRHANGDFECEENQNQSYWSMWFSSGDCPRYTQENRRAEWFANMSKQELNAEYNGMRAYYDLRDLSRENKDPRLALRIEVELPVSDVRTASKIDGLGSDAIPQEPLRTGFGAGMFGTEDQMAGGGMTAIAAGELYFHPPDDYNPAMRTGRYEIASLFSPYWEVHLIDMPMERHFMAWALRDETLLADGASGVAEGIAHFASDRLEELEQLRQLQASLQSQLDNTFDTIRRGQIETQLAQVSSQIDQLESAYDATASFTERFEQEMTQGLTYMENAQVAGYEEMFQEYGELQGDELIEGFQDELVDQATGQLQQTLEQAVETTVESAMSSIFP
ncbi:MAG: Tad domain-containing protein [Candidatus Thiodiazotropha sp.]